ncbi:MAG: hypothetical protein P4L56_18250 [Candidatus Sulfopaludibacter sp.]|nr:hypothetical protein [Candidatus Sulfopaludibacter sp.]
MLTAILKFLLTASVAVLLLAGPAFGQQTDITRFDAYVGYAFLNSPHIGLFENGVAMQVGYRPKRWYSLGFDYSVSKGNLVLTPNLLPTALQQQLGAQLGQLAAAGMIPPTYNLAVPTDSVTQTFAVGPQLAYRRMTRATLFFRPVFAGAIHEAATPHPGDPIATGVAKELAPNGVKTDTAPFVGFGGGFDIIITRSFSIRTQADLVYDHLFNDLLRDGRFTVRFSIGPAFNFGPKLAR